MSYQAEKVPPPESQMIDFELESFRKQFFEQHNRYLSMAEQVVFSQKREGYLALISILDGLDSIVRMKATKSYIIDIDAIDSRIKKTKDELWNNNRTSPGSGFYDLLKEKLFRISKEYNYLVIKKPSFFG